MNQAAFLEYHNNGLGGLLGIRIQEAAPQRVVSILDVKQAHFTGPGRIHGGVIMTLADCTAAYGAIMNMPAGHSTATIESKTNFLRRGRGDSLRAESVPLHVGRSLSVWRTQIWRGEDVIAEVTQTQMYFEASGSEREATAITESPQVERPADNVTLLERGPTRARRGGTVEDRKRQIFDAACEVIAKKGFANASIREIAAAAGMPVPTMYQYIQGKGDLLLIIYQHFMDDLGRSMRSAEDPARSPMENFRSVLSATLDAIDATQRYIRLMFQETKSLDKEMRQKVFELDRDNIEIIKELLAAAKAGGECECGDEEVTANIVYFLCTMWPLRHWALEHHGRQAVNGEIEKFVLGALVRPTRQVA